MRICLLLILAAHAFYSPSPAQQGFINPVKGEIRLSGTFCEIRPDHFHSGIDLKTGGKEGYPVYAVADGYIYRVKVSSSGYGKALYILHEGQMLTVYAHLLEFSGSIADSVRALQYRTQSFEQEYFPDSGLFKVKQGDLIALSGNSGGSEGPHLHFELRDQRFEEPLNPLTNGWQADDTIEPVVTALAVYGFSDGVYGNPVEKPVSESGWDTVVISADTVALAMSCYDIMNDDNPSQLGIYQALIIHDSDTLYSYRNERMNFDHTRSVNAHIDSRIRAVSKKTYQRFFTLPGNEMKTFADAGSGLISLTDSAMIRIVVYDHNNNFTERNVFLKKAMEKAEMPDDNLTFPFPHSEYTFQKSDMRINLWDSAFYQTETGISFTREKAGDSRRYLKMVPTGLPLRRPALIAFRIPHKWKGFEDKAVVAVADNKGKVIRSAAGVNKKGWIETTVRSFNNYTVAIDTVPPKIEVAGIYKNHIGKEFFYLKISDVLSGIGLYSCTVDGLWHLFEYDAKSGFLSADVTTLPPQFALEAFAQDNKKNTFLLREKIDLSSFKSR